MQTTPEEGGDATAEQSLTAGNLVQNSQTASEYVDPSLICITRADC